MSWEKIVTVGKNAFKDKYIFFKLLPFITFCIYIYIYIYIYILYVSSITEGRQMSCRTLRNNFYNCHWCVYTLCSPIFSHTVLFPNGSQNFLKKFQRFFGPSPFSTRYYIYSLQLFTVITWILLGLMSVSSFVHKSVLSVYYFSFHSVFFKWDFCDSEPFHHFPYSLLALFPPLCNYYLKHFSCIFVV